MDKYWLVPFKGNWVEIRQGPRKPRRRSSKSTTIMVKECIGVDYRGYRRFRKAPLEIITYEGGKVITSIGRRELARLGFYTLTEPLSISREALVKAGLGVGQ